MREIVHCQIGECGNSVGINLWDMYRKERCINSSGQYPCQYRNNNNNHVLDNIHINWKEHGCYRYVPRAISVDTAPDTLDNIRVTGIGKIFKPENYIFGASGCDNNFAKGYYAEGAELIDEVMDVVRREIECCYYPQGIKIIHSLGGGTGSGLGSLLLSKIRDYYSDIILCTYSVFPYTTVTSAKIEPYNVMLALDRLVDDADETFVIHNEACLNICRNILKRKQPKKADLNWVISLTMADVSASLRFPTELNSDLRRMGINLIPFPRLHFLTMGHAPFFRPKKGMTLTFSYDELDEIMFSPYNDLSNIDFKDGKYLSCSINYRGNTKSKTSIQHNMKQFVSWIPDSIKKCTISIPSPECSFSGSYIGNTTGIKTVLETLSSQFATLYKRKAFCHWYLGEGMDIMRFQETDINITSLIHQYQDKQDILLDNHNVDMDMDTDDDEYDDDVKIDDL